MFSLDGFVNNIGKAIDIADAEGIPVQDALRRMSMYERQKEEEKKKKQIQAYTNEINSALSKMASEDKPKLEFIDPKKLKYSSSDVNYDKARKMASDWDKYGKKEVIISKDNYVEDGATTVEAAKIKNKWVRVLRMNYKHTDK